MSDKPIPRMRTAAKIVAELRAMDPGCEVTEYYIRQLIRKGALPPMIRTRTGGAAQLGADTPGGRRPSSTRKLICPRCGISVRATRAGIRILYQDCMERMVEV